MDASNQRDKTLCLIMRFTYSASKTYKVKTFDVINRYKIGLNSLCSLLIRKNVISKYINIMDYIKML